MPVYLIYSPSQNAVKIGESREPMKRLKNLQIGSADGLEMLRLIEGGAEEERQLHIRYADRRIRGEWFEYCPSMQSVGIEWIDETAKPDFDSMTPMRRLRVGKLGLTPSELARVVGVSQATISRWEHEVNYPHLSQVALIFRYAEERGIDLAVDDFVVIPESSRSRTADVRSGLESVIDRVRDLASKKGWSLSRIAKSAGLHGNSLRRVDDPTWSPNARTLLALDQFMSSGAAD